MGQSAARKKIISYSKHNVKGRSTEFFREYTSPLWAFTTSALPYRYVLYKDENLLWSMFYWHHSCHDNVMTPFRFLLSFAFFGTRRFFRNRLRELVPPLVASMMAKFEQILWERFRNILKQKSKGHKNSGETCYRHNWLISKENDEVWKCSFIS